MALPPFGAGATDRAGLALFLLAVRDALRKLGLGFGKLGGSGSFRFFRLGRRIGLLFDFGCVGDLFGGRLHFLERGDFAILAPDGQFGVADLGRLVAEQHEPGLGLHVELGFGQRLDQQLEVFDFNIGIGGRQRGGFGGGRRRIGAGRRRGRQSENEG